MSRCARRVAPLRRQCPPLRRQCPSLRRPSHATPSPMAPIARTIRRVHPVDVRHCAVQCALRAGPRAPLRAPSRTTDASTAIAAPTIPRDQSRHARVAKSVARYRFRHKRARRSVPRNPSHRARLGKRGKGVESAPLDVRQLVPRHAVDHGHRSADNPARPISPRARGKIGRAPPISSHSRWEICLAQPISPCAPGQAGQGRRIRPSQEPWLGACVCFGSYRSKSWAAVPAELWVA
jgi:hypothetical protein